MTGYWAVVFRCAYFCALLVFVSPICAARLEWDRKLGNSTIDDRPPLVAADKLGNVFVGEMRLNRPDVFLSNFDSAGNFQWTQQIGTPHFEDLGGLSVDGLGNAYIAGATYGDLGRINPGPSDTDVFLAKFDSSGSQLWMRQLGSARVEWCQGVSADALANVFVVGQTNGTLAGPAPGAGARDGFIGKYDSAGNELWTRQFGPANPMGVSADGLGNVYVTGEGRGPGTTTGQSSAFVTKYDGDGEVSWTRQFAATPPQSTLVSPQGIAADHLGNVYVAGQTFGSLEGPITSAPEVFLRKYDAIGNVHWTLQLLPNYPVKVSADGLGNVYLTGGPTFNLPGLPPADGDDSYLMKFDAQGSMLSINSYATPSGDFSLSVSADGLGNAYISGLNRGDSANPFGPPRVVFVARFSETVAIPEPPILVLMPASVIGLVCARRWRR